MIRTFSKMGFQAPGFMLGALTTLSLIMIVPSAALGAESVPSYLEIIVDEKAPTAEAVAAENVYALDTGMNAIYADNLIRYKDHMRERFPVIFAFFNTRGGQMVLLPPGEDPIVAPPVPDIYTLAKSVAHSSMAVFQLVAPYVVNSKSGAWRAPMERYKAQMKSAEATLADLNVTSEQRKRFQEILQTNIDYIDSCLKTGKLTNESLTEYARGVTPLLLENVKDAADAQVGHWEKVLGGWKTRLGDRWKDVYAVTNTLYVTRGRNILFSILAQFMGKEAINDRLLLVGTTSFETTQAELFEVLVRIVADRAIGEVFFKNPRVMDVELLGDAAREAIMKDATSERPALLPPLAPYDNHQWPWATGKGDGGPTELEDLK